MNIWDTPGGDHFTQTNKTDYNNADAVVMVYSIDISSSYDDITDLHETAT